MPQVITVVCVKSEMRIKRLLNGTVVVTGGRTWLCIVEGNDVVRGPVQAWQLAAVCVQYCPNSRRLFSRMVEDAWQKFYGTLE